MTRATWYCAVIALVLALGLTEAIAKDAPPSPPPAPACGPPHAKPDSDAPPPTDAWSAGSVTVGGASIEYCAVAGTIVVHPKDWDDSAVPPPPPKGGDSDDAPKAAPTEATMFYVAYNKRNADPSSRPITFVFNGGPGSATVWLHMGAFGPRRVETANAAHSAAAPYRLVNNDHSLLDVSDVVFIDAPGTGFGRVTGPDKDKAFYGIDEDAYAFAKFITEYLTKYQRWNSPKYLFGESYGTMRAAVVADMLETDPGVDFNGIIMLSQVLAANLYPDQPTATPGNDLPYELGLPTYAATAWYHRQPADQRATDVPASLLSEAEHFAMGDYAAALAAGASLDDATTTAIVTKLHDLTGLSEEYLRRANIRVSTDEFRQELLRDRGLVIGGTDTRFEGHTLDRMSRKARYDPSDTAIASAYVSTFNDYARRVLKYSDGRSYRPTAEEAADKWDYAHQPPDQPETDAPFDQTANVMPDLATAMKLNPLLKVQLNAGYYDLLTPYFQGQYEMRHLPIPPELRANIEYRCYQAGHMVYLTRDGLARLHDNVADFIERTDNLPGQSGRKPVASGCASDR